MVGWMTSGNVQGNFNPLRFAGGVVAFHVAFALLEKRRIENYEEKGEVNSLEQASPIARSFCWQGPSSWSESSLLMKPLATVGHSRYCMQSPSYANIFSLLINDGFP